MQWLQTLYFCQFQNHQRPQGITHSNGPTWLFSTCKTSVYWLLLLQEDILYTHHLLSNLLGFCTKFTVKTHLGHEVGTQKGNISGELCFMFQTTLGNCQTRWFLTSHWYLSSCFFYRLEKINHFPKSKVKYPDFWTNIVSVLWREEGYTVKYSLIPRELLRAEPKGFFEGSGYFSQYIPTWVTIHILSFS